MCGRFEVVITRDDATCASTCLRTGERRLLTSVLKWAQAPQRLGLICSFTASSRPLSPCVAHTFRTRRGVCRDAASSSILVKA
eukprot:46653-Pleurochrysis_carterae.AAC.1